MSDPRWRLGERLDLLGQVGTGAAGTVWRGRELSDGSLHAVKLLRLELVADRDAVDAFYATLGAVGRLGHPGIAAVDDVVVGDGYFALRSRLVQGESLRALTTRLGALAPDAAARLIAQVCDALAAAHAVGLVHGGLHPDNVLITAGGDGLPAAVVTDVGIAELIDRAAGRGFALAAPLARYRAPERAYGMLATSAADVYAAGILLADAVGGRPPFTADWPPLAACLDADPRSRPGAAHLAAALREAIGESAHTSVLPSHQIGDPAATDATTLMHFAPDGDAVGRAGAPSRVPRLISEHKTESGIAAAVAVVGLLIAGAFALGGGGQTATAAGTTVTTSAASPAPDASAPQTVVLPPAASPSPSPSMAQAATGQLTLVNDQSNTCLDTAGRRFDNGTTEDIYSCNGTPAQVWNLTADGQLTEDNGAYCLDDSGFGTTPGTKVILWSCHGTANQQWMLQPDGSVVSVYSKLCLDIDGQGSNTADGTALVLWQCDGQQSQHWTRR